VSEFLHQDRNGCALHGAIKSLSAVQGLVPVLHANPGCSLGARYGENTRTGSLGGAAGWLETSSTNLQEKHVVFGGTSRLREQLKNTVKVLRGDLYVVVTGCVPEVVGDDIQAMVKESREQKLPSIGISAPGFKGNGWSGHATTVKQVLEQLASLENPPREPRAGLVNLLGIAPGLDPFWEGDLEEIAESLERIEIRVQRLFGLGSGVRDWKEARNAALNIVLSPWGLEAAQFLLERDGIPFLDFGHLPVGSRDLGDLVRRVARELGLAEESADALARAEDARQRHHLRKSASAIVSSSFQRRTAVVAGSASAIGLARFLSGTLGQILTTVVFTDAPPEELRADLVRRAREASESVEVDVWFADDADAIRRILGEASAELVLGSALETAWAREAGAASVEIALPLREELVLDGRIAGTRGALAIVSRIWAALRDAPDLKPSGIRPTREQASTANAATTA